VNYYTIGTISPLHRVLGMNMHNVGDLQLFDLLQRAAEEKGMMKVEDKKLDEYVPAEILREFLTEFMDAFVKLMFELGFETKVQRKKEKAKQELSKKVRTKQGLDFSAP